MKTGTIIFLSIFFLLYGVINYYIFIRGWQVFPKESAWRYFYLGLFIIVALSFFMGRTLERYSVCTASSAFAWIGSFWFGYILYLILGIIIVDIMRLLMKSFHFYPAFIFEHYERTKQITALIVFGLASLLLLIGYINARNSHIRKLEFNINKQAGKIASLKIAFVSDIHLGNIIGNGRLTQLVSMINSIQPDIVLLGGDVVDEDVAPVISNNMGDVLKNISSRYGVFAITGNHEYIGGVEAACQWMQEHGITVLRDTSIKINDSFYLVGREDRSKSFFSDQKRKPVHELLKEIDTALPVVLLDHDPTELKQNLQPGVDVILSGHTHHGQLFPLNMITDMVYTISWGYKKFGDTHAYVSCGYGSWGPPARLGNKPEVMEIVLRFKTGN